MTRGPQDPTGAGSDPVQGRPSLQGDGPPPPHSRRAAPRRTRRRRNVLIAVALVGVLLVAGLAAFLTSDESPVSETGEWRTYTATPADAFLDTVGVVIHEGYGDTAYGENDLMSLLMRLNVRHIRDATIESSMPFYRRFVERAGPGAGVSYVVETDNPGSIEEQLQMIATQAPGTASQIESHNEPDCDDWSDEEAETYREQARAMRSTMDRLEPLRDLPLTTPSFCRTSEATYSTYGDDGVSERFNIHPYAGGLLPEEEIDEALAEVREADPDAVPVVTEAGYHNAVETDDDHMPTSELAESAYLPQMFLEYNRSGIPLTFTYELLDLRANPERDYDQENFGLFYADGSIKPSGASMAALLGTLRDAEGARPESEDVEFSISGGGEELRVEPFVRSDGSIDVVLWRAQKIWDEDERVDLPNPSAEVTVERRSAGSGSYVRIDGSEEPERVELGEGTSPTVPVSAHPTILRLGGP